MRLCWLLCIMVVQEREEAARVFGAEVAAAAGKAAAAAATFEPDEELAQVRGEAAILGYCCWLLLLAAAWSC